MKSYLALFLFLILFTIGAHPQEKSYKIDLSGQEKETVAMNISSIAADVDYIALEATPQSYLADIFKVIKTKDNFLVSNRIGMKVERLVIFDLHGSFKALSLRICVAGPGTQACKQYGQCESPCYKWTYNPE